jgi:aminopeptidase
VKDPRYDQLARNLIRYSCNLQPGEKVLIDMFGTEMDLVKSLIREAYAVGGVPFVNLNNHEVTREILKGASAEQIDLQAKWDVERMKAMDAYIGIRAGNNASELSDVPAEKNQLYLSRHFSPVHGEVRVNETKWVVLRYPNHSMAQLANMSTEAFEDFYFQVCNLDYSKMDKAMDALVELMEKTDQVHIKGPGTDLTFSIKGIPAIKCSGHYNIPDGEVYTAPVRNSVNGTLTYNTPTVYGGYTFENIHFEFKDGKIIHATSSDTERMNKLLDTDEGARYIGEFAIGVNPYILHPMKDTLFDEKIDGSFHFTPGRAYKNAFNGNISSVHWDIVCIQRPDYGGGEMYFDGRLIRKDGRFVVPELEMLNPENLK